MTWSHVTVFPRLAPHTFTSNSDWSIVLFTSVVIGQSNYGLVLRHSNENCSNGNSNDTGNGNDKGNGKGKQQ